MVEKAVKMILLIISEFNVQNISEWNKNTGHMFLKRYSDETQSKTFRSVLLLYQEVHFLSANWVITYQTHNLTLIRSMHKLLGNT